VQPGHKEEVELDQELALALEEVKKKAGVKEIKTVIKEKEKVFFQKKNRPGFTYERKLRYLNRVSRHSNRFVRRDHHKAQIASKNLKQRNIYARINMLRTLPSFVSMLIRLFYITKTKFDDFIGDNDSVSVDPDLYFDSVIKRFLLF